jgi:formylglycine-generating enzyme required for sulfatase activity
VVGTKTCPNQWGVQDLIGNVFEWTGTEAWAYPGSNFDVGQLSEPTFMIRGGGAYEKSTGENAITSTFRVATPGSKRSAGLGFRLVREN